VDGGANLIGERRLHGLVGFDFEDPLTQAGRDAGGLALALEREDPVDHPRAELARDLLRAVGAAVRHHHDLVAEFKPAKAVGKARLIVMCANQC
jgi:hypothetical protein